MKYQYMKASGISSLLFKALCIAVLLLVANASFADRGYPGTAQTATNSIKKYEKFGQYFADSISKRDIAALAKVFDMKDFANITGHLVYKSDSQINGFIKGVLTNSKQKFLSQMFFEAIRSHAKGVFIRVLKKDQPLVRIDFQNGGHQYLILHVKQLDSGKLVFVDMYRLTTGKNLSASIADAVQLMQKPSSSFIMRVFGRRDVDPDMIATFKKIALLKNKGKYEEAYKLLESFPESVKKQRTMIDAAITISQHINNREYRKQLSMLDKYYGDDNSTVFTLIDYYFFKHEYNKIQAGLDSLIAKLGEDGALDELKADAYLKANDYKDAIKYSERAIKVEPQYQGGYWTLVTVLNAKNDYGEMIKTLGMIEKQFGYTFTAKSFEHKRFYKKFVKSPEFKAKYL